MRNLARSLGVAVTILSLSGCVAPNVPPARVGTSPPPQPVAQPSPQVPSMTPAPPTSGFIPPQIMREPGLGTVIGRNDAALLNMFGAPALDVKEGDARKLQFRGSQCVLDVFLYPLEPRAAPVATWVEARRPSDGRDVDRARCIDALRR